jgi:hypothetical protein
MLACINCTLLPTIFVLTVDGYLRNQTYQRVYNIDLIGILYLILCGAGIA